MDEQETRRLDTMGEREVARILGELTIRDGLWVVESVTGYGGEQVFNGAAILELKDGKIWRDTRYFAEPFEVPEWRSRWVERMEP